MRRHDGPSRDHEVDSDDAIHQMEIRLPRENAGSHESEGEGDRQTMQRPIRFGLGGPAI